MFQRKRARLRSKGPSYAAAFAAPFLSLPPFWGNRELYEVPEITPFVAKLDGAFPHCVQ